MDISADYETENTNEAEMIAFFKAHTSQSSKHVIMVTIVPACDSCGGPCTDEGDCLVSIFSSLDKAMEWVESYEGDAHPIFEPFVIDNPSFDNIEALN